MAKFKKEKKSRPGKASVWPLRQPFASTHDFPLLVAQQLARGLRCMKYQAFTADSCLPLQPQAEPGTITGTYPVLSNLSAFLDICYSFYLLSTTIFYLLIPTHPLKLSLDEPSFRKTALKTLHLIPSQTKLYHIHFSVSSLDHELLADRTMTNTGHTVGVEKLLNE